MTVTLREAASALNISMNTARRWIKSGRLESRLQEGVYGQEYVIEESEIARLQSGFAPKMTIVHSTETESSVEVPTQWLLGQLEDRLSIVVRDAIREQVEVEMEPLRAELAALRHDNEVLQNTLEDRLAERDRNLMVTMKSILEARREEAERSSWLVRLFSRN